MGGSARLDGGNATTVEFAAIVAALPTAHPVMSPDLTGELVHLPLEGLCDQLRDRRVEGRPSDDVAPVAVRQAGARA